MKPESGFPVNVNPVIEAKGSHGFCRKGNVALAADRDDASIAYATWSKDLSSLSFIPTT